MTVLRGIPLDTSREFSSTLGRDTGRTGSTGRTGGDRKDWEDRGNMEYIEDRMDNGMKDNLKSKEKAEIQ